MSSYLNIYIVPKKDRTPIEIVSYSSADDIYAAISEVINITWSGEELQYVDLSIENINEIIDDIKQDINKVDKRITEYEKHANGNADLIEDILSQKEYREGLDDVLQRIRFLSDIIYDAKAGFSDVEKVICTIT